MERLTIQREGAVLHSVTLDKDVITIGRDAKAEIQLDDASVSRRHATLTKINSRFFVEDLGSTNGTFLNRKKISMHILKNGDQVMIGHFTLRFETDVSEDDEEGEELEKTVIFAPSKLAQQLAPPRKTAAPAVVPKTAALRFKGGRYDGQTKKIEGSLYTLGQPGGDVAVIARRPQGFFLLHIGGNTFPRINGVQITSTRGVKLEEGDQIEVGSITANISFGAH
jgi:pSer/pThr/pTyr-binding forkhead associated (FHA) protein